MPFDVIDEMLFEYRDVDAIIAHRKQFRSSLAEANKAVMDRLAYLREYYSKYFAPLDLISIRAKAVVTLQEIEIPILTIESLWNNQSIEIFAIVFEEDSENRFKAIYLTRLNEKIDKDKGKSCRDYGVNLVNELAEKVSAIAYHAPSAAGSEHLRWWSTEQAKQSK